MTTSRARETAVYIGWLLLVAAAYFVSAKIGLSLAFSVRQVTAVWPPTGIAIAALVLGGYRMWPGIFVGAFLVNAIGLDEPLYTALAIGTGNTLGPLLGAYLMRAFRFDRSFARVRDVIVFLASGAVLSLVTATNGTLQLVLGHEIAWATYPTTWRLWWIGDVAGVLLVAPFILTWRGMLSGIVEGEAGPLEIVVLIVSAIAFSFVEFFTRLSMAFPLYPFVVWSALRVGARVTTAMMLFVCTIALWATLRDLGPFTAVASVDGRMTAFVLYTAVLMITGLVLSALTAERRLALVRMQAAERRFQVLAETLPQIVWTADPSGRIDWINQRWYQYAGQKDLSSTIPDWPRLIAARRPFERELRLEGDDGVSRWFLVRGEPMRDERGRIVRWYGTHTDIDDQRRALERTSHIATTLQSAFLPQSLPQHPHLRFDALYLTAGQEVLIGGDWYDAFAIPGGRIVISIGDVTGHGLNAAVSAGRIRQSIVATAIDEQDPAQILTKVNRLLQFHDTTVATALVAVIEPEMLILRYASAGHPSPIIAGPSVQAKSLPHGSLPLGVSHTPDYRTHTTVLTQNDVAVFYTDGITEFARDIETAERALRQAVNAVAATPAPNPAERIRRAVLGDIAPSDDAVIVVLRVAPNTESAAADDFDLRRSWSFHSSHAYSAHHARHEVMQFIQSLAGSGEELFTAELILGEILANTVEHAPGLVTMEIDWCGTSPVVTVTDTGPGLERFNALLPQDALTEDGRGLYLVKTLARDVFVEADPGYGTKMTVTLPIARASRRAVGA